MAAYIDQSQWDSYREIQEDFWEDNAGDTLFWEKSFGTVPRFGEDRAKNLEAIPLKCLFQYNNYRTWPVNIFGDTGEEDKQSEVAIFSIKYLNSLNLLEERDGQLRLIYNPTDDRFRHLGWNYEATGDTAVAQAGLSPIFFMIILKRYNAQAIQKT